MRTSQRNIITVLILTFLIFWPIVSGAQQLYPYYQPPSPYAAPQYPTYPGGSSNDKKPWEKYQYTFELPRLGLSFQYACPLSPKDTYSYTLPTYYFIGIGLKDVQNGMGLSVDVGGVEKSSSALSGYWIRASGLLRLSSKMPSLYLQPSYKYQKISVSGWHSSPDNEQGTVFYSDKIAPHELSLGPSLQLNQTENYVAMYVSSGELALSFGPGVKEFAVTIINVTLVIQPVWF